MAVRIAGCADRSARTGRYDEKDITLDVSLALRDVLQERGVSVVMTRSTDTLIALSDRGRIANAKKGDVFLSIHVNAANPNWKQPGARARLRDVLSLRGQDRGRTPRGGRWRTRS